MINTPWFDIAKEELGTSEVAGPGSNPRIITYDKATTLKANDDAVPWCSAFVCWCLEEAGLKSTRSARARSYLDWGVAIEKPVEGCVVILQRGDNPAQGHVGFYTAENDSMIQVLGGNQHDMVKMSWFKKEDVLGYRWPFTITYGDANSNDPANH